MNSLAVLIKATHGPAVLLWPQGNLMHKQIQKLVWAVDGGCLEAFGSQKGRELETRSASKTYNKYVGFG